MACHERAPDIQASSAIPKGLQPFDAVATLPYSGQRVETGGIEQASLTQPKTTISKNPRTESDTVNNDRRQNDPDLAYLSKVWPDLQDSVKQVIMDLIKAQEPSPKGD